MKIVTLTLNPALDQSTSVSHLAPDIKMRCAPMVSEPGGGGINVSKALHALQTESVAVFPSGGSNGAMMERLLREAGVRIAPMKVEASMRENLSVTDRHNGLQYRFVLPSPLLSLHEADACLDLVASFSPDIIVASGSLPDSLPVDYYQRVAALARRLNARLALDTSGQALCTALEGGGVYLIKPNLAELSALAGVDQLEMNEVDDAALEIVRQGKCEVIVVSMGPQGALLVTADGFEHIPAPMVKPISTVGAGDSMVAGMVWAIQQGMGLSEMASFGVACGSAATLTPGSELFRVDDAHRLYEWLRHYGRRYRILDFQ